MAGAWPPAPDGDCAWFAAMAAMSSRDPLRVCVFACVCGGGVVVGGGGGDRISAWGSGSSSGEVRLISNQIQIHCLVIV